MTIFYSRSDGYSQAGFRGKRKYQHIAVAERALGRSLPANAEVHHVNENKSDNRPENLVICPSAKYHQLLHMRMRAIEAGHPAHFRRCYVCKLYGDPATMYLKPNTAHARHRSCDWKRK